MNDIDRLQLLINIISEYLQTNTNEMGKLAFDIESLCNSIENTSEKFKHSFSQAWDTLEILQVNKSESKIQPNTNDINVVNNLLSNLVIEAKNEITIRS